MPTFRDHFEQIRSTVRETDAQSAHTGQRTFVDVGEQNEVVQIKYTEVSCAIPASARGALA